MCRHGVMIYCCNAMMCCYNMTLYRYTKVSVSRSMLYRRGEKTVPASNSEPRRACKWSRMLAECSPRSELLPGTTAMAIRGSGEEQGCETRWFFWSVTSRFKRQAFMKPSVLSQILFVRLCASPDIIRHSKIRKIFRCSHSDSAQPKSKMVFQKGA